MFGFNKFFGKLWLHPEGAASGGAAAGEEQWDEEDQEGNPNADEENSGQGDKDNPEDKASKKFSQEEVNKIAAREKREGKAAAFRELGYTEEQIKEILGKHKQEEDSRKTPEQIAAEERAAEEAKARVEAAEREAAHAKAESQAMRLHVHPDYVEDVIAMAMFKRDSSDDPEGFDFKSFISSEVKSKHPHMFNDFTKDDSGDKSKEGKRGTGGAPPKSGDNNKKPVGIGSRLAAQKRESEPKKSFWD